MVVQVILPVVQKSVDQHLDSVLEMKERLSNEFFQENVVTRTVLDGLYKEG